VRVPFDFSAGDEGGGACGEGTQVVLAWVDANAGEVDLQLGVRTAEAGTDQPAASPIAISVALPSAVYCSAERVSWTKPERWSSRGVVWMCIRNTLPRLGYGIGFLA
jgi:hypothetical protein